MDNLDNEDGFNWQGQFITDPRKTHCGRFEVKDSHMVYGQNYLDWLETKYRKIKFSVFDAEDGETFTGYFPIDLSKDPFNGYWNGWLCPYVLKHEHERIYNWFAEETPEPQSLEDDGEESFLLDVLQGRRRVFLVGVEDIEAYRNDEPNKHGLYYWGSGYVWKEHRGVKNDV